MSEYWNEWGATEWNETNTIQQTQLTQSLAGILAKGLLGLLNLQRGIVALPVAYL